MKTDPARIAQLEQEVAEYSAALVLEEKRANTLHAELARCRGALEKLLNRYVELVECGDCGNWNPHVEPEVIEANAALRESGGGA